MCRTVLLRSSLPSRDTNYGALLSDMDVSAVGDLASLKAFVLEGGGALLGKVLVATFLRSATARRSKEACAGATPQANSTMVRYKICV